MVQRDKPPPKPASTFPIHVSDYCCEIDHYRSFSLSKCRFSVLARFFWLFFAHLPFFRFQASSEGHSPTGGCFAFPSPTTSTSSFTRGSSLTSTVFIPSQCGCPLPPSFPSLLTPEAETKTRLSLLRFLLFFLFIDSSLWTSVIILSQYPFYFFP